MPRSLVLHSGLEAFGSSKKRCTAFTSAMETGSSMLNDRPVLEAGALSDLWMRLALNPDGADVAFEVDGQERLAILLNAGEMEGEVVGFTPMLPGQTAAFTFKSAGSQCFASQVSAVFASSGEDCVTPIGSNGSGRTDIIAQRVVYVAPAGGRRAHDFDYVACVAPFDFEWRASSFMLTNNFLEGDAGHTGVGGQPIAARLRSVIDGVPGSQFAELLFDQEFTWVNFVGEPDLVPKGSRFAFLAEGLAENGYAELERLASHTAHATKTPLFVGGYYEPIRDEVKYFPPAGRLNSAAGTREEVEMPLGYQAEASSFYFSVSRADGAFEATVDVLVDGVVIASLSANSVGVYGGDFLSSVVIPRGKRVCYSVHHSGARIYAQCFAMGVSENGDPPPPPPPPRATWEELEAFIRRGEGLNQVPVFDPLAQTHTLDDNGVPLVVYVGDW